MSYTGYVPVAPEAFLSIARYTRPTVNVQIGYRHVLYCRDGTRQLPQSLVQLMGRVATRDAPLKQLVCPGLNGFDQLPRPRSAIWIPEVSLR